MRISAPLVMGILNVTPDSFSDGGKYPTIDSAVAHAERMIAEGADWIDIGGESTRPNAEPVPAKIEQARVLPVIERLATGNGKGKISIDTRNAETAALALAAGASLINDVSGGMYDPRMFTVAATANVPYILMHTRGSPQTMTQLSEYGNVVDEVKRELLQQAESAIQAGVDKKNIWIDPGIGFAKTPQQSYELLRGLPELCYTGFPVVVGCSRKRFIGFLDNSTPDHRLGGSVTLATYAILNGATMVRVHDVAETKQAIAVAAYLAHLAEH